MENSLVSIIIPVYNVEMYINECLDSVINQTYKNTEIILVDDGSTDNSGNICEEYAKIDSRIKVIHKHNEGQSAARNRGLDIANGKYVMFIDSDDKVDYRIVECLSDIIGNNDIAMCDREKFDDALNIPTAENKVEYYNNIQFLYKIYDAPKFIAIWGKLYNIRLFEKFRFKEGIIFEDEDALPQLIYNSNGIVYTTQKLYFYRQRPNSTTSSSFSKKNLDIVEVCERRIDLFKAWNLKKWYKKSVKDYYYVLKKLCNKASEANMKEEYSFVVSKLSDWSKYGVKFNCIEKIKNRLFFK